MTKKSGKNESKTKIAHLLREYSQNSTIAGLHYVFESKQSGFGGLLWSFIILFLTLSGVYVSVESYIQWKNEPVLTTVATTGFSVESVEFPSVVICSQGSNYENFNSNMYKLAFDYLRYYLNIPITLSPLRALRYASQSLKKVKILIMFRTYVSIIVIMYIGIVVSIEFSPLSTVELTTSWYHLHNGDYQLK